MDEDMSTEESRRGVRSLMAEASGNRDGVFKKPFNGNISDDTGDWSSICEKSLFENNCVDKIYYFIYFSTVNTISSDKWNRKIV